MMVRVATVTSIAMTEKDTHMVMTGMITAIAMTIHIPTIMMIRIRTMTMKPTVKSQKISKDLKYQKIMLE